MRHGAARTLVWLGSARVARVAGAVSRRGANGRPMPSARRSARTPGVTVSFVRGSMEIDTNGRGALAGVATWLQNGDQRTVRLEGYADKTGGATGNQRLSERRAQAAKDFLVGRGIEPDRIMVFGHGEATDRRRCRQGGRRASSLVTACDVPKEVAAETPPPPEPQAAATPDEPPAPPAPHRRRPPRRAPAPRAARVRAVADVPPAAGPLRRTARRRGGHRGHRRRRRDRLHRRGRPQRRRNGRLLGRAADVRVAAADRRRGRVRRLGPEHRRARPRATAVLLGNGVEGTLRVNLTRARIQPYLFGGVGLDALPADQRATNTSSVLGSDDIGTVPLGAGMTARLGTRVHPRRARDVPRDVRRRHVPGVRAERGPAQLDAELERLRPGRLRVLTARVRGSEAEGASSPGRRARCRRRWSRAWAGAADVLDGQPEAERRRRRARPHRARQVDTRVAKHHVALDGRLLRIAASIDQYHAPRASAVKPTGPRSTSA